MNKLIAVLLLIAMLLLPALPVAATSPIPHRYFIDAEGACVAPDGDGVPTVIEGANISYFYEKGGTLAMRCRGPLPESAAIPDHFIKLDYNTTGLFCAGKMKDTIAVTVNYAAVVYPLVGYDPPGFTEIICRFGPRPQVP